MQPDMPPTRVHVHYGPLCLNLQPNAVLHQTDGYESATAAAAWRRFVLQTNVWHVVPSFHERTADGAFLRTLQPGQAAHLRDELL